MRRRLAGWSWLLPGAVTFILLRLPSLFEPHWYTDEASYVSTGLSVVHGHVLYAQIWSNKPPLQLWTIGSVAALFGPSELALHLLTLFSGGAALAAVAWAGARLLGRRRAAVAMVLAAIALGLPILDAELAIPESLLIAPLSWAGAVLLVALVRDGRAPRPWRGWPVVCGVLVAAAIGYQQTAVAEATAFGAALALSPRGGRRALMAYAVPLLVLTGAWVGVAVVTAGLHSVGYALAGFYIAYTRSVLPSSGGGAVLHIAEVVIGVGLVAAGAVLQRHRPGPRWLLLLWSAASLSVPALANQPYPHYLAPAVVPLALLLATLPAPGRSWVRRPGRRNIVPALPQLAGLAVLAAMASVTGLDWIPAASSPTLNSYRNLGQYYGGAITAAIEGRKGDWDDGFDSRVAADESIAQWLKQEGLTGATAVVWSSDSWLYSLADLPVLMPTPPIYNDEVLLGQSGQVEDYVAALDPELLIVSQEEQQEFPEIGKLLQTGAYERVFESDPYAVWVRSDVAPTLP